VSSSSCVCSCFAVLDPVNCGLQHRSEGFPEGHEPTDLRGATNTATTATTLSRNAV
jgi:hypothetical protein